MVSFSELYSMWKSCPFLTFTDVIILISMLHLMLFIETVTCYNVFGIIQFGMQDYNMNYFIVLWITWLLFLLG